MGRAPGSEEFRISSLEKMNEKLEFESLPDIVLGCILESLPAKDLAKMTMTSKRMLRRASDEVLWRRLCQLDWPWFFYDGSCEYTLIPYLPKGVRTLQSNVDHVKINDQSFEEILATASQSTRDFDGIPICNGDLGRACPAQHRVTDNPYHPLLSDKVKYKFKHAYQKIISGKYTGMLQIMNSLSDRTMSAFTAIVTYDRLQKAFHVCYQAIVISRYRRGLSVILHPDNPEYGEGIDETILVADRHRFRRIPEDLLDFDPRELYAREMFMTEVDPGIPSFSVGEEVEIQWRVEASDCWSWWRGIVAVVLVSGSEEKDAIIVVFPHFPEECEWFAVAISTLGIELPNLPNHGFVGGIRRVKCLTHTALWKRNFERVPWPVTE